MTNPFRLLYGSQEFSLESSLSIDEIKNRLSEKLKSPPYISIIGRPLIGYVKDSRIFIYREQLSIIGGLLYFPAFSANMNYPVFKGELLESSGNTILKGKFTLNTATKLFYTFSYIFYLAFFIVANITLYESYREGKATIFFIIITLIIVVFLLSLLIYFTNRSIRKSTMPDIPDFSVIYNFLKECFNDKKHNKRINT